MKMDMFVLCATCLSFAVPVYTIEWMSTPGTLRSCVNEDATFLWDYDESSTNPVTLVQWQFITKGVTILQKQIRKNGNVSLTYYDYGPEKVGLTSASIANAGIVLKEVQRTDSGGYRIRVSGGMINQATLQVYSEEELEPSLEINNSPVLMGSTYNMSDCSRCVIVVTTAHSLPANISIQISSQSTKCTAKSTCSRLINLADLDEGSNRITFRINYGFCSVKERYVDVVWDGETTITDDDREQNKDKQWSPGGLTSKWEFILGLTLGILLIILIIMCVVMVILVKWVKRKQRQENCNLSQRQKGLVNAVNKWRSVASSARRPIARSLSRTPNVVTETPESLAMVRTIVGESSNDDFPDRNDPEGGDVESAYSDPEKADKVPELESNGDRIIGEGSPHKDDFKRLESTDSSMLNDFVVVPRTT